MAGIDTTQVEKVVERSGQRIGTVPQPAHSLALRVCEIPFEQEIGDSDEAVDARAHLGADPGQDRGGLGRRSRTGVPDAPVA